MKSWLACFLLCLLGSVSSAQTALSTGTQVYEPIPKPYFFQTIPLLTSPVLGPTDEEKRRRAAEHAAFGEALARHDAEQKRRALDAHLSILKAEGDAKIAELQRRAAARQAEILRPRPIYAPSPVPTYRTAPSGTTTVIHSAGQGVYTTHGGAAGGATITQPVPGVWEVRRQDGSMQRILKP